MCSQYKWKRNPTDKYVPYIYEIKRNPDDNCVPSTRERGTIMIIEFPVQEKEEPR
jgi:hypothetical protein